jgi:hypothetical protein
LWSNLQKITALLFLTLLSSSLAQAMVFDMGKERFGSYLRSTYSPWGYSQEPFAESSGNNMSFNNQFTNLLSYEFGFMANAGAITWRFGFELIQPPELSSVSGTNAAGTQLYNLDTQVSAYLPKIGAEINLKTWGQSRLWTYLEVGYATLTVQNTYSFTPAGTTQFGIPNFREVVSSTQTSYAASLGFETLMSDSTTFSFEVGYRMLDFSSLNMSSAVTNFQGNMASGATALRNDNVTGRDLNMSGPFAAVNLRIWVY